MLRRFEKQVFELLYDRDSGATFSDYEFKQCRFEACGLSLTLDPRLRTTVRNVHAVNCELIGCGCGAAVFEDVLVDGLKSSDVFQFFGAVFKHVVFRGKIDDLMFSPVVEPGRATAQQQRKVDEANAKYYEHVDWAIDISAAEFKDCGIRGGALPARLIRRDPETQVIVTRRKAAEGEWRRLDLSRTYWDVALTLLLESGYPDTVLVAPKRSKNFKHLLQGLHLLRKAGIAEPA